jgi:hypothetical protein
MISNITCFYTQVGGKRRIECSGNGPWIPCLYPWFHEVRSSDVTAFLSAGLLAADFSPVGGGRVCFAEDTFSSGEGFVQLIHPDGRTQRISRLHFWGILQALLGNLMKHHSLGDNVGLSNLEALAAELAVKLGEDATQGVVHVQAEQFPWSNGDLVQATIVSIQHAQGFLPSYPEERFWEELRGDAADLIHGRVRTSASTWARVETTRTNVVDYLTLAGVWGEDLTEDFLDSTGPIQQLATSYTFLRRYADHPLRRQLNPAVSNHLSFLPFGIDWFHFLSRNVPGLEDEFAFTAVCESKWRAFLPTVPGKLETHLGDYTVRLEANWVEVGRLGWVGVSLITFDDELEFEFKETWRESILAVVSG